MISNDLGWAWRDAVSLKDHPLASLERHMSTLAACPMPQRFASSAGDNLPVHRNGSTEASAWPSTYRRLALSETTALTRLRADRPPSARKSTNKPKSILFASAAMQ